MTTQNLTPKSLTVVKQTPKEKKQMLEDYDNAQFEIHLKQVKKLKKGFLAKVKKNLGKQLKLKS